MPQIQIPLQSIDLPITDDSMLLKMGRFKFVCPNKEDDCVLNRNKHDRGDERVAPRQTPHTNRRNGWVSRNSKHFTLGLQSEKAGTKQRAGHAQTGPLGCSGNYVLR